MKCPFAFGPATPHPHEKLERPLGGGTAPVITYSLHVLNASLKCYTFSLYVTTSVYPVPSICAQDQISDWFDSLAECLHWNVRKKQKQIDELSDLTHSSSDTLEELDANHHDTERPADT